jgi:solute:Na+ symporter, SSS family
VNLAPIDFALIGLYFTAVLAVGLSVARRAESDASYFVGNRQLPWWAVFGSLIGTEVSAATFLATPGVGYHGNLAYLQFGFGSLLARVLIGYFFLNLLYRHNCLTVYQFLKYRFGPVTQRWGSGFFLLSRLCASAVRLMIAATGLHLILSVPFEVTLAVFAGVCLLYSGAGGIRSVVWTDCIQALVFLSSGVVVLGYITVELGGWGWVTDAWANDRFAIFTWQPRSASNWLDWLADANLFWLAFAFGTVNTMAMMGTDHDFTQRLLACSDHRKARRSLILSGLISLPVAALFLGLGIALSAYFAQFSHAGLPLMADGLTADSDRVFPVFIRDILPAGLRGLVVCGVLAAAMSSLDSTLAALSSSAVIDLGLGGRAPGGHVRRSRWLMVVAALLLVALALVLQNGGQFLWLAFKVSAVTYSGLLGVFVAGVLSSQRGRDRFNPFAMVGGSALVLVMTLLIEADHLALAWQLPMLCGVFLTAVAAALPHPNRSLSS